ncbi:acetyl esterase [Xylaria sp. FL0043]|nr:acetyl esterase [Xylaria sp. FL0043]
MPLTSDIVIDYSRFDPNNTSGDTKKYSDFLEKATDSVPRWYEVGAPRFREIIEAGELGGLKPVTLPEASDLAIPSREPGRNIPVRMYKPDKGASSKGILLHIHGGGYTLGSHRHAEHGELLFLAGESGGAHFAVLTAFALLRSRPAHILRGLVLPYGNYSLALGLPSMVSYDRPVVVNHAIIRAFMDAYTPGWSAEERRNPLASPMFENLGALAAQSPKKKLPPALFLCGTNDPLLDDTLLMGVKWLASGSEAVVKIFPGAPHVFNVPSIDIGEESFLYEAEFIRSKLQE